MDRARVRGSIAGWAFRLQFLPVPAILQPEEASSYCCFCSVAKLCPTLCDPMDCSPPGFHVLHYLLEFAWTHVHWVSDAVQPSHPLSPPLLLPSVFPRISLSNEYSESISFRNDWFDLRAVQLLFKLEVKWDYLLVGIPMTWRSSCLHLKKRELLQCRLVGWLVWLHSVWDLSSPSRDWTCVPCIGRWILNHRATRKILRAAI